ncbi:MAG TPA: bis(5'-nucleosyl)-tetraphosphatase (symmetrical) YqeK [Halanaerobiales bacterium]|nr:bis(5'-nucleosyl)-tetraphosphatase (symmetrical) YqeK [Halanaerobiales bacterium]
MYNIKEIKEKLMDIKGFRKEHTFAVEETAVKIAQKYNVDLKKVKIASLLHDYARHFDDETLLKIVEQNNIEVDNLEKEIPTLLHSPVGAYLVEKYFNIKEKDILNAIRYHTIGRTGMSKLEKIIFVADVIEPGRNFPGVDLIREKIEKDLDEAVILVCDFTIKYNIDRKRIIHPNTLYTRNSLLKGEK